MIFINLLIALNAMLETMRPSYLAEKDDQGSNMNLVWKLSWPSRFDMSRPDFGSVASKVKFWNLRS